MTFVQQMHIFMSTNFVDNRKNVQKPMCRTFTLLFLLFASISFIPKSSSAASMFEISNVDAKFGEKDLIKFYPNPMITDANIKISEEVDLERSKVSVIFYNIVGSEVYKINQVKEYDLKIYREIFKNAGIYFYQLKIDESVMSTGRITVK